MGTGKSTVGRILAERLNRSFIDTDSEIEAQAGMTVAEVFERHGEAHFRRLEEAVIGDLREGKGRVIATGGGAVLSERNRDALRGASIVCLTAEPEVLLDRTPRNASRPLLRTADDLWALLAEREAVYALFPQVDTSSLDPESVA